MDFLLSETITGILSMMLYPEGSNLFKSTDLVRMLSAQTRGCSGDEVFRAPDQAHAPHVRAEHRHRDTWSVASRGKGVLPTCCLGV